MGVSVTKRALAAVAAVAGMVLGSGPGHANLVLNSGFEDLYDNWYLDFATVAQCAALGCAPNGGDRAGALGGLPASGNRSFSQTVTLPGAGTYSFGADLRFFTKEIGGNLSQAQIGLTVLLPGGASEIVGTNVDTLAPEFVPLEFPGISATSWLLFEDFLTYAGSDPVDALIYINVQLTAPESHLLLYIDNVFLQQVPAPAATGLFVLGVAGLGATARRCRRRDDATPAP